MGINSLKNKKILITAGPTWVVIDDVRVISNTASGQTGIFLAEKLAKASAKVTLVLGAVASGTKNKKIKVIPFKYFDELKSIIARQIKSGKYDIVIHSAAVSDYRPEKILTGKIKSGLKKLKLVLFPTVKIISQIKKIDRKVLLVGFKYEPEADKIELFIQSRVLIRDCAADIVVANTVKAGRYQAYVIRNDKIDGPLTNKAALCEKLIKVIEERKCQN